MTTTTKISSKDYKKKQVIRYEKEGFALFPIGQKDDEKAPAIKNWRQAQVGQFTFETLPRAYAINLAEDDFILDVDPRRFENDVDQLEMLWTNLGIEWHWSDTFHVVTPDGGTHVYLKKPGDIILKTMKQMTEIGYGAIELKSAKHYVIAAGSIVHHAKSDRYRRYVAKGKQAGILDAPDELLEFCERDSVSTVRTGGVESDSSAVRDRYIQFCKYAPRAVEGSGGDDTTFNVIARGKEWGLPEEANYRITLKHYNKRCDPAWSPEELRIKVANVYQYGQNDTGSRAGSMDFDSADIPEDMRKLFQKSAKAPKLRWDGKKGDYKPTVNNVLNFFQLDSLVGLDDRPNPLRGLIFWNAFSSTVDFTRPAPWHRGNNAKQWEDVDTVMLEELLSRKCLFNASPSLLDRAVVAQAYANQKHPIVQYLDDIEWDGKPRLDKWLIRYCGAKDTEYVRAVGKNTLMAAVARVRKPGCKHDSILVLEGEQGIKKSEVVKVLGGGEVIDGGFYLDLKINLDKLTDTVQSMQGGWIIETAEMDFTRKADIAELRSFITRAVDKCRLAYGRRQTTLPRQSIFIGTFNPTPHMGYLNDPAGNRRFWPVHVTEIDIEALKRDRDQLFAEANHRVKSGENYYLDNNKLVEAAKKEQNKRVNEDAYKETIENFVLELQAKNCFTVSSDEIAIEALGFMPGKLNNSIRARIATVLEQLGYEKGRVWDANLNTKVTRWRIDP